MRCLFIILFALPGVLYGQGFYIGTNIYPALASPNYELTTEYGIKPRISATGSLGFSNGAGPGIYCKVYDGYSDHKMQAVFMKAGVRGYSGVKRVALFVGVGGLLTYVDESATYRSLAPGGPYPVQLVAKQSMNPGLLASTGVRVKIYKRFEADIGFQVARVWKNMLPRICAGYVPGAAQGVQGIVNLKYNLIKVSVGR